MNCIEFRQLKLAEPHVSNRAADAHKLDCPTCTKFEQGIHQLDESIYSALSVAIPEGLAAKVLVNQSLQSHPRRPMRRYLLGMAASFLLAIFVFQLAPVDALEDEIITHMDHEAHQVHGKSGDNGVRSDRKSPEPGWWRPGATSGKGDLRIQVLHQRPANRAFRGGK
jgi:hypothetical protein